MIKIFFFIFKKLFKISLYVKGMSNIQTEVHLKTFKVNGGISNNVANFPTMKLPDQKNAP